MKWKGSLVGVLFFIFFPGFEVGGRDGKKEGKRWRTGKSWAEAAQNPQSWGGESNLVILEPSWVTRLLVNPFLPQETVAQGSAASRAFWMKENQSSWSLPIPALEKTPYNFSSSWGWGVVDVGFIFSSIEYLQTFIEFLLCAKHYPKYFAGVVSVLTTTLWGAGCIIIPILQINRSLERLSKEPKVI